ncbi:MAG: hypothetical protein KDD40_02125 [Bdellovibrionales bacterium]|nr:hypothetical protein [Bdellovibrionales bacterium]
MEYNRNARNTLLSDIPNNKFWFYSHEAIKGFFGFESKHDSEILKKYTKKRFSAFIVSSDPIDKSHFSQTKYGFYYKHVKTAYYNSILSEVGTPLINLTAYWHSHGQIQRGHILGTIMPSKYSNADEKPRMNEFLNDEKLVGLIFVSSNRASDAWIIPEYLELIIKMPGIHLVALKTMMTLIDS